MVFFVFPMAVIWRNKITGTFLFYKYVEDHPEEKLKTKKKPGRKPKVDEDVNIEELEEEELEEEMEAEAIDEENELLDCIADYQEKYGVKKVNVNTKKFKAFFEEWKKTE